ncbi:hypothetical protein CASFOL_037230 [Castilleja foliolosa]|uniref:40S ribosomal protein S7 n=1 Tax=Castilleja foliolosa TaxID=1961234 RepID=A0ABD3BP11_9LAMI
MSFKMYTASQKIQKDKDAEPTEFEENVAQEVVIIATRRIVRPPKKGSAAQRPRTRTLVLLSMMLCSRTLFILLRLPGNPSDTDLMDQRL